MQSGSSSRPLKPGLRSSSLRTIATFRWVSGETPRLSSARDRFDSDTERHFDALVVEQQTHLAQNQAVPTRPCRCKSCRGYQSVAEGEVDSPRAVTPLQLVQAQPVTPGSRRGRVATGGR